MESDGSIERLFAKSFGRASQARAYSPGRIEVIGNHTDYNEGSVIGVAVDRGITVALSARGDGECHLVSEAMEVQVIVEMNRITRLEPPLSWANYPLGVVKVMMEEGFPIAGGFNFAGVSNLPHGAGMSSSAALELATGYALTSLFGFEVERKKMVQMCRRAENEFVGLPCGILDQGVSAFGGEQQLVHIDCATQEFSQVPIPPACHFWIFNSNKKHALVQSKYSERHRECQEAFQILRAFQPEAKGLAQISPEMVRAHRETLGETRYRRALHITEENQRVAFAVQALDRGDLAKLGVLLTASHRSSQNLFENSCAELDFLVDRLTEMPGVYGARLSGGGFGGAVMALTDESFEKRDEPGVMATDFFREFGIEPSIFHTRAGAGADVVPLISLL